MAEIVANSVRLHVQRLEPKGGAAPDSPVVVMVHGMVMDNISSFYFALGNCLAGAGCEVICYDLRGHGRSERTPSGYTMADSMADLAGLLDALGVDRPVHIVGNSYGATLTLAFGLANPERVASLTLVEPPFLIEGLGEEMARSLTQVLAAVSDEEVEEWLANTAGRAVTRIARSAQALLKETSIAQDMLATPPFSREALTALPMPVLAVYGANSDIIDQAEGLAELVPDCTLVVLEQHTHMVLREAADYLRDLLRWWLLRRDQPMPRHQVRGAGFDTPDWVRQMIPPPDLNGEHRTTSLSTAAAGSPSDA
ncbi:alpha/beta hydrolase [Parafrankia colletiae]|uniref:Alpha/beta hydrolase n=1 Tax=Parafrankia colletiae TaxID=573497 RepID=A0A1S1QKF7_9ACTN|nr:alpha/beta fold hydrolase [Parafrankia colletiae]MCK9898761.1 alpha/beta hydrolase [Frankia sp. Cpl3]OHV33755.1 alpha/beta hydrolase [Parafrankia colletiae]